MGKRGPKPVPTETLRKRGSTLVPRRTEAGEPQLELCTPEAPAWLGKGAKKHWPEMAEMLADMGVLTRADRGALAAFCDILAVYIRARNQVDRETLTITNVQGNVIINPAVKVMQAAWAQFMKACAEFGLTPSARSGVRAVEPPAEAKVDKAKDFCERGVG
jgi:P27 family predicted phage terminase small subunit